MADGMDRIADYLMEAAHRIGYSSAGISASGGIDFCSGSLEDISVPHVHESDSECPGVHECDDGNHSFFSARFERGDDGAVEATIKADLSYITLENIGPLAQAVWEGAASKGWPRPDWKSGV